MRALNFALLSLLIGLCTTNPIWAQALSGPTWRHIAAPDVGAQLPATWVEIDAPGGHKLVAAIFTPAGTGPFPVVALLHGSGGFGLRSIALGEEFARTGFLAVAGCWFTGSSLYDPPPGPLVSCPNAPAFYGATLYELPYIDAIVKAARTLPGAKGDKVGLIGQSRGATMTVLYASNGGMVQAAVADSANYTVRRSNDTAAIDSAQNLAAPLLMLHGTHDQTVSISGPHQYEAALVRLGKPHEVKYYENSEHVVTRRNNDNYADAVGRAVGFFEKYLAR